MAVTKTKAGTWAATLRGPDGRERQRTFARKVDADAWERGNRADVDRGAFAELKPGRTLMREWAPLWLAGLVHITAKTRDRYRGIVAGHILPRWGHRRLDSIGHGEVQEWIADLIAEGQSPASVHKTYGVLSRILALAVADRRLARNVADGIKLPRIPKSSHRYLTHAQVAELVSTMRDDEALAVQVLAYCGLRFGELAALQVGDVEHLRRRISVSRSVTVLNGRLVWGEPKDHERRAVPIPRFLADALAAHCGGRARTEPLFTARRGGVLRVANFRRDCFDPAAAAADLEGLHPHELRHTAASLAISAGANVKAVQLMLGHANASMTLDVYAELFPDDLDQVADALDAARERSLADISRTSPDIADISKRRAAP